MSCPKNCVVIVCPDCNVARYVKRATVKHNPDAYKRNRAVCRRCAVRTRGRPAAGHDRHLSERLAKMRRVPATAPTTAPPGSRAKIAVMAQRYERGQLIDHPRDRKLMTDRIGAWLDAVAEAVRGGRAQVVRGDPEMDEI